MTLLLSSDLFPWSDILDFNCQLSCYQYQYFHPFIHIDAFRAFWKGENNLSWAVVKQANSFIGFFRFSDFQLRSWSKSTIWLNCWSAAAARAASKIKIKVKQNLTYFCQISLSTFPSNEWVLILVSPVTFPKKPNYCKCCDFQVKMKIFRSWKLWLTMPYFKTNVPTSVGLQPKSEHKLEQKGNFKF